VWSGAEDILKIPPFLEEENDYFFALKGNQCITLISLKFT
jgi:hypothetical protein